MRSISFSLTTPQFLDGSKTVTRRMGWKTLKPGTQLRAVRKAMGLKKGEHPEVLGIIEVVSARRERLDEITFKDVDREGFHDMTRMQFIEFFCAHMGCSPETEVTRIEFRRVSVDSTALLPPPPRREAGR